MKFYTQHELKEIQSTFTRQVIGNSEQSYHKNKIKDTLTRFSWTEFHAFRDTNFFEIPFSQFLLLLKYMFKKVNALHCLFRMKANIKPFPS